MVTRSERRQDQDAGFLTPEPALWSCRPHRLAAWPQGCFLLYKIKELEISYS